MHIATGFIGLKAVIELLVRDRHQRLRAMEFQVDPGSNITTIPMARAREALLAVPPKSVELQVNTAAGKVRQRVHAGHITVRVPGLEGREFSWPCHIVEHRGPPPAAALGLAGVINDLRIIFDGTYALEARYGWLVLEEVPAASIG